MIRKRDEMKVRRNQLSFFPPDPKATGIFFRNCKGIAFQLKAIKSGLRKVQITLRRTDGD